MCCTKDQDEQVVRARASQNNYTASFHATNTSTEHIYTEMRGTEANVYQEADTLLETDKTADAIDTNAVLNDIENEPVTIKRSYSSPKGLATLLERSDSHDFKDPTYVYPYDKVARSESNANSAAAETLEPDTTDDDEIIEHHNKHNKQHTAV